MDVALAEAKALKDVPTVFIANHDQGQTDFHSNRDSLVGGLQPGASLGFFKLYRATVAEFRVLCMAMRALGPAVVKIEVTYGLGDFKEAPFLGLLRLCSSLQELIVEHGRPEDAVVIGDALQYMPSLRVLALDGHEIGPSGAAALCGGLRHVPLLMTLRLMSNSIGPGGATEIADALSCVPLLTTLKYVATPK